MVAVVTMLARIHDATGVDLDRQETYCLARVVYNEARGEPIMGQVGVAYTLLNRTSESEGGVCHEARKYKQFAWKPFRVKDLEAWSVAVEVAAFAQVGFVSNPVGQADHFYAYEKVEPYWAEAKTEVAVIGGHRFMD